MSKKRIVKNKYKQNRVNSGLDIKRWRLLVAMIFLFIIALIFQLYRVQVRAHSYYHDLAIRQQQINTQLQAERGKVFFSDYFSKGEALYPLATNKEYADIYAIPKDIKNPRLLAEMLFNFFDRPKLEAEIRGDKDIESNNGNNSNKNKEKIDSRLQLSLEHDPEIVIPQDIKQGIIDKYMLRLDKPGDPYEPLINKVELSELVNLYAYLYNYDQLEIDIDSIEALFTLNSQLNKNDDDDNDAEELNNSSVTESFNLNKLDLNKLIAEGLINANLLEQVNSLNELNNFTLNPQDLYFSLGKIVYTVLSETEFDDDGTPLAWDKEVKIPGLGYSLQKYRYYPEQKISSHLLGFTVRSDNNLEGRYGLEEFFNYELSGKPGFIKTDRANHSNLIILNDREYIKPENGSDIVLTIDRNIQSYACQKLEETVNNFDAEGGSVIILEPKTGEIIAMCSVPSFDPNNYQQVEDIAYYNNPAIFYQYEPGSVFKIVTMAIAIDQGKVTPSTTFKDEGQMMIKGWPKPIRNSDYATHGPHGVVDMNTVLDGSLNTGAIFAMNQVGSKVFADYLQKFGFGEKTGIELGAEASGNINNLLVNRIREIDAATASFGQGIAVTPLQMIMPFQAIANDGLMMKPHLVKSIVHSNGYEESINPKPLNQVISKSTADTMLAMLANVVEKGHSHRAAINGYYVGGKTGTAQIARAGGYAKNEYIHNFVGLAPVDNPAFVMLTKIDKPKGIIYAEGSALPLWREIAEFILNYYAIPTNRK